MAKARTAAQRGIRRRRRSSRLAGRTLISAWIGRASASAKLMAKGSRRPATRPMPTPMPAMSSTCTRCTVKMVAGGGAEALEGGDDLAAAIDEGRDRIGDADATYEKGSQADERQELAQALERACHLRMRIATIGDREAAIRQLGFDLVAKLHKAAGIIRRRAVQCQGIAPAHEASRTRPGPSRAAYQGKRTHAGRRSGDR